MAGTKATTLDAGLTLRTFRLGSAAAAATAAATAAAASASSSAAASAAASPVGPQLSAQRLRWASAQVPALCSWAGLGADGDTLYVCAGWASYGVHAHAGLGSAAGRGGMASAVAKMGKGIGGAAATPYAPAASRVPLPLAQDATCLTVGADGATLLVGCADGSAVLWPEGAAQGQAAGRRGRPAPPLRLIGHTAAVSCVALAVDLALAATGSEDGTLILHDTQSGAAVRSISTGSMRTVHAVALSGDGYVAAYSADERTLCAFSVNGEAVASAPLRGSARLRALLATPSSAPGFFALADESGVTLRRSHDLSAGAMLHDVGAPISSAAMREAGPMRLELALGLANGQLATWTADVSYVE